MLLFGIFCYVVGRFVERYVWCETGRTTKILSCRHKEKQRIFHVTEQT
jgi:hypothetical protein